MKLLRFRVIYPVTRHGEVLSPGAEFEIKSTSSRCHVDRWLGKGWIEPISANDGHNADQQKEPMIADIKAGTAPGLFTGARVSQGIIDAQRKRWAKAGHKVAPPKPTLPRMSRAAKVAKLKEFLASTPDHPATPAASATFDSEAGPRKKKSNGKHPTSNGNGEASGVKDIDPETARRSPFNREIDQTTPGFMKLAKGIKEHGVLQNAIVRSVCDAKNPKILWEIIAGERRWLCAKKAKKPLPVTVRECDDTTALEIQAMENLDREDLNPIDEATKYEQLRAAYEKEGLTKTAAVARIEEKTGKGESTIYERLSLMKLPFGVRDMIAHGTLPASHAGLLTKLHDPVTISVLAVEIASKKTGVVMGFREAKEKAREAEHRETRLAAWQREKENFLAKGWHVLTPEESAKIVDGSEDRDCWHVRHAVKDYVGGDKMCDLPGASYRNYDKLWKKAPLPVLARQPNGGPAYLYRKSEADESVRAGGKLKIAANGHTARPASEVEKERKAKERAKEFLTTVDDVVRHIEHSLDSAEFWRFFALMLVGQWRCDPIKRVAKRRGWAKGVAAQADMVRRIAIAGAGELRGLCTEILLFNDWPSQWSSGWGKSIRQAAALSGLPLSTWGKPSTGSGPGGDSQVSGE
jgi:ParB/RepB/Spo0J family partition protein